MAQWIKSMPLTLECELCCRQNETERTENKIQTENKEKIVLMVKETGDLLAMDHDGPSFWVMKVV